MIGIGLAHDLPYVGSSLIRTQQDNTTSEMIKPSPNRSVTPIFSVSRRRHIFRMVADSHAPWRMICWSGWNQCQGLYSFQRDRANGYDRRHRLRTPDSMHAWANSIDKGWRCQKVMRTPERDKRTARVRAIPQGCDPCTGHDGDRTPNTRRESERRTDSTTLNGCKQNNNRES
jgi:hypothetical protein